MEFILKENDEYIKLGQLLKACCLVNSGADSKRVINEGLVKVNYEVCLMRGKKIHKGDIIIYQDKEVNVI